MDEVERLRILTGESNSELLSLLLEDAKQDVLAHTNRTEVIPAMEKPIRDLALIAYNRMGTEGEAKRQAAGESYEFDNDQKRIYEKLNRYRLARVGGRTYEAKKKPPEDVQA